MPLWQGQHSLALPSGKCMGPIHRGRRLPKGYFTIPKPLLGPHGGVAVFGKMLTPPLPMRRLLVRLGLARRGIRGWPSAWIDHQPPDFAPDRFLSSINCANQWSNLDILPCGQACGIPFRRYQVLAVACLPRRAGRPFTGGLKRVKSPLVVFQSGPKAAQMGCLQGPWAPCQEP
jgi:hypothetical protein